VLSKHPKAAFKSHPKENKREQRNRTMATAIATRSQSVRKALFQSESLRRKLQSMKAKGDEMAGVMVHSAEVGMGALVMGGIQGRFGDVSIGPVPVSLGAGLALHAAGFAGIGGRNAQHLHGLADGCLAAYLTTIGTGVGANMRKKAVSSGMAGDVRTGIPGTGGGVLTDEEQAALAQSV